MTTSDEALFGVLLGRVRRKANRLFAWLMVGQWIFAVGVAILFSPFGWEGKERAVHVHVWAAILLGGVLSAMPLALIRAKPDWTGTRYVVACAQMLWSALLIHLSGGRIETHFHVFGSLAFLAYYRDWKLLLPATVIVSLDHLVRGLFWPESVYGIVNPEWWRFLEHAFWVVFEDIVLFYFCVTTCDEIRQMARKQTELEAVSLSERQKSQALDVAMQELRASQETLVRVEKLAAIGQLAASVGHELRNPLTAVRNAASFISKKVSSPEPRVIEFFGVIDREVKVCTRIISDLLDFARERPPALDPCPLKALVDEAIGVVPHGTTRIDNRISEDLPVPFIDRDQFRQVLINLLQNAVDAVPQGRDGVIRVSAEGGAQAPWRISIEDNGAGIPEEVQGKIFEPLFTTKPKGTGLGLAVVANMIKGHRGRISVASTPGVGTTFAIELPLPMVIQAA